MTTLRELIEAQLKEFTEQKKKIGLTRDEKKTLEGRVDAYLDILYKTRHINEVVEV